MENERIELPLYLGKKVQEELKNKYGMETDNRCFSQKELELVKEITIVPPLEGGLKGIENLTNLQKLVIDSPGNTAFQTKMIPSISNEDIDKIAQCKNLIELSIINQSKITDVDCNRIEKFKKFDN